MEPFTHKFPDVRQLLLAEGIVIQHQPSLGEYRVTVSMASIGEKYPEASHPEKVKRAEAIAYYTSDLHDAYTTGLRMSAEFHQQVHLKENTMPDVTMGGHPMPSAQRAFPPATEPSPARITERLLDQSRRNGGNLNDLQNLLEDTCRRLTGGLPDWPPPSVEAATPKSLAPELTLLEEAEQVGGGQWSMINRCLDIIGYINTHC